MGAKESKIEQEFINQLRELNYVYRDDIRDGKSLRDNFRSHFERLNFVHLSDHEFERLMNEIVTPDVFKASQILREKQTFIRDDGTALNYTLVNIKDWCKNDYEVCNQLRINTADSYHRYDVIILINGLPLVQIELKDVAVSPLKAIEQIAKYKRDRGNGYTNTLMCFMQLFIVSNGASDTLYFANNNDEFFRFDADEQYLPVCHAATHEGHKVLQLHAFASLMLPKCSLGRLISRYMVLVQSTKQLLVMRPYQIYAVESILQCVEQNSGYGYIWHTTGSGKTLTSFKASTLLKGNPNIEKCVFVVDRKDLDNQTREEFNRFQPNCVEQNVNTGALVNRLCSEDYADKVIVTTIQKLALALDPSSRQNYVDRLKKLQDKRMVFIFDECHRSQFGENRKAIEEFFPKAQMFGFTGTPIFEENSSVSRIDGTTASYVTTKDVFQKELHQYTITNAIDDLNVLRFHIDYFRGEQGEKVIEPSKTAIVRSILEKHDAATNHRKFNALFATSSIDDAIEYFQIFEKVQTELVDIDPDFKPLNITCVFTPPAEGNKDIEQLQEDLEQEKQDLKVNPDGKKQALDHIIDIYNDKFHTHHSLANFDDYYRDVQKRIKNQRYANADLPQSQKVDIVIVVDMLLTGFDSKYLNTLYVDKDLKYHGLIQAFSRTNRILNASKPYGNIICFRDLRNNVDVAMTRFSGADIDAVKKIWLVAPAQEVIRDYHAAIQALENTMHGHDVACTPDEVLNLSGADAQHDFLEAFKKVQGLKTRLDQYTDLTPEQKQEIEDNMDEDTLRAFRGAYLETAKRYKEQALQMEPSDPQRQAIIDYDCELVLFASTVVDYDYIMNLISLYTRPTKKQRMTKQQLLSTLASSAEMADERDFIAAFIETLEVGAAMTLDEVKEAYQEFKDQQVNSTFTAMAADYSIDEADFLDFVNETIRFARLDEDHLNELFSHLGWKDRKQMKESLVAALAPHLKHLCPGRKIDGLSAYVEE